jgi:hypothetical protein
VFVVTDAEIGQAIWDGFWLVVSLSYQVVVPLWLLLFLARWIRRLTL